MALEDATERELSAHWSDPTWRKARAQAFFEVRRLHRAFLSHERNRMRFSLGAAIDTIQGKAPADTDPTIVADAWDTLFFVIPLVSTILASQPHPICALIAVRACAAM
ncbi:hypothetical protein [Salinisphaera sp. LB1]|uniref:hypothetical protein n=1 Tax=Salinisphaera sp. LB1 TaxID=2183911 RepID=UPI000D7053AD|nr:hypothetical protein [Salinisphaera sp. LB1]